MLLWTPARLKGLTICGPPGCEDATAPGCGATTEDGTAGLLAAVLPASEDPADVLKDVGTEAEEGEAEASRVSWVCPSMTEDQSSPSTALISCRRRCLASSVSPGIYTKDPDHLGLEVSLGQKSTLRCSGCKCECSTHRCIGWIKEPETTALSNLQASQLLPPGVPFIQKHDDTSLGQSMSDMHVANTLRLTEAWPEHI